MTQLNTDQLSTSRRPRVHLSPTTGWMNDPHGVFYADGTYHLFFQHVPDSLEWRTDIAWGHATSTNLLHWQVEPIALPPGDGDEGCWSGTVAIDDDGRPVMFYTSVAGANHQLGRVRVARPNANWSTWVKGDIVAEAVDPTTRVFRDPMVFRDGDRWRMLVGAGVGHDIAGAEVFSSPDLTDWRYDGLLATREAGEQHPWTGTAWECPQLVRSIDGHDVLVVSIWDEHAPHDVAAATGTYHDGRFTPNHWQLLTAGTSHFAASTFTDAEGRACLIFWIRGINDPGRWAGVLSVPYLVNTEGDDVRLTPHPCLDTVRAPADGPGTSLDIEWALGDGGRLALVDSDGQEQAVLEVTDGRVTIGVAGDAEPVLSEHTSSTLRLIVDAQVLEVVTDGGLVGLPLPPHHGLVPHANRPDAIAWWHLA